jgi:hypothetical protein
MEVQSVVRRYRGIAFLGIALGAAVGAGLGSSPVAAADPISDWQYGGTELPGYADPDSVTNPEQYSLGPFGTINTADYNYDTAEGGTPWYSVSDDSFDNDFYQNDFQQVTNVLDSAPGYPSDGTVADQSDLFINTTVVGQVPLITSDYLDDPKLGFEDLFGFTGTDNVLVSDSAGIEDVLTSFGQSYTLFDIPFTAASGATAGDLADSFQPLLTEFASMF